MNQKAAAPDGYSIQLDHATVRLTGNLARIVAYLLVTPGALSDLQGTAAGKLFVTWGDNSCYRAHVETDYSITIPNAPPPPLWVGLGQTAVELTGNLAAVLRHILQNAELQSKIQHAAFATITITWSPGLPLNTVVQRFYPQAKSSTLLPEE